MIKKLVLPLSAAIILMLLLPFLFSRGWKATLSEYVQRELPGNVLFTDTKEDFSHIAVKVLHADTNIVEDIPIYDYLCGVVAAEMSPEFELEALKAQTVAACSYMVYRMEGELSETGADRGASRRVCLHRLQALQGISVQRGRKDQLGRYIFQYKLRQDRNRRKQRTGRNYYS